MGVYIENRKKRAKNVNKHQPSPSSCQCLGSFRERCYICLLYTKYFYIPPVIKNIYLGSLPAWALCRCITDLFHVPDLRQSHTDTRKKISRPKHNAWMSMLILVHTASLEAPPCFLHHTRGIQQGPDEAPHLTEAVNSSLSYIRVTLLHLQGTIHFPYTFTH